MTATLPTETLVVDLIEARTRRLMAERASLPEAYPHRSKRAELRVLITAALDQYGPLAWGPAPWRG
jgi:hypothetical protein